jgi:hypothetical protein
MKRCFKCGKEKDRLEFYKHPKMSDGLLGKCKECTKKDSAERIEKVKKDPQWLAIERARCRDKSERYRQSGKAKRYEGTVKRWRKKHPIKHKAHSAAIRAHPTPPEACSDCGTKPKVMHRHHPDYSKPKEIVWLCPKCHGLRHRKPLPK